MDIPVFEVGQLVRLRATFVDPNNRPIDPTTVRVQVTPPSEPTAEYGDGAITKDAVGSYYMDQTADTPGLWGFRWYSNGTGQGAKNGAFVVEPM